MVKAKEFLNYLCEDLGYKIFLGPECEGFLPLYKHMNKSFTNYMPTVNETVALGMAIGNSIGGRNSCVLMDVKNLCDLITPIRDCALKYRTPFLILVYTTDVDEFPLAIPKTKMTNKNAPRYKEGLKRLVSMTQKDLIPGMFFIKEGILV